MFLCKCVWNVSSFLFTKSVSHLQELFSLFSSKQSAIAVLNKFIKSDGGWFYSLRVESTFKIKQNLHGKLIEEVWKVKKDAENHLCKRKQKLNNSKFWPMPQKY